MSLRPLATCAVLALLPAAALAGGGSGERIVIEQVQLGAQITRLEVHVPSGVETASASAVAGGNSAASLVAEGDNSFAAHQTSAGDVSAETLLAGGPVYGEASVTTTAFGNSSNAATEAGNNVYRAEQVMDGDTSARTQIALQGAGTVTSTTIATANVSMSGSQFGDNRAFQVQEANGSVRAATDAVVCCIAAGARLDTIAAGNAAISSGSTSTSYNGAVQTTGFGGITIAATSNVYSESASNVTGSATAAGNTYVLENEWGYATLGRAGSELYQGNGAAIVARSDVELDHWSGMAESIAEGAGNAAFVTNIGSDTGLYAIQSNFAGVDVTATLTGQSWTGGTGQLVATATGNIAGAVLCNTCGQASLSGGLTQFNQGDITASAHLNTPVAGHISASASAIGNAATFQSGGR